MKIKKLAFLMIVIIIFTLFSACSNSKTGTTILYQGHASLRIISEDGIVIYIDPYRHVEDDYEVPADIILITHGHCEHNNPNIPAKKDDCVIIRWIDALADGEYKSFPIKGIQIEAVEAKNPVHSKNCVGYIITVDDFIIYVAGDTGKTGQMKTFSSLEIDYAFFPCDEVYNLGMQEAIECAEIVGAKHNIPYHATPHDFGHEKEVLESFYAPNRLILLPGDLIYLEH